MENPVPHTHSYEAVAPSAAAQVLGNTGAVGDLLELQLVNVTTSATGTVSIQDGNDAAIVVVPANTPIGAFTLWVRCRARVATTPGWRITTGAGAQVIAVGKFT